MSLVYYFFFWGGGTVYIRLLYVCSLYVGLRMYGPTKSLWSYVRLCEDGVEIVSRLREKVVQNSNVFSDVLEVSIVQVYERAMVVLL